VFHILIWEGLELCLGAKPTIVPAATGLATSKRLFRKLQIKATGFQ